jgi:hypothetical protein
MIDKDTMISVPSGGANEILVPNGLPSGSVGPWEAL